MYGGGCKCKSITIRADRLTTSVRIGKAWKVSLNRSHVTVLTTD